MRTEVRKQLIIIVAVLSSTVYSSSVNAQKVLEKPTTYCNPINIDYDFGFGPARHASDPTIVLFKNKYYLFTSWDFDGYRVSDDMILWERVRFAPEIRKDAMLVSPTKYTAPAVATDGKYIYFFDYNTSSRPNTPIIRSDDPLSGKWEVCGQIEGRPQDPCLFIDQGRFFVYHGLGAGSPTASFELDPTTMTKIKGSDRSYRGVIDDVNKCKEGYHLTRRELYEGIDAKGWVGKFASLPCPEGAWMTRFADKYYLQYSTPGTVSQWYCDIVMEGDSPNGPFHEMPYNPVSLKVGGFMGGAGHSCVFQDKYGNWWRSSTMWVGTLNDFERRMALFPVSFDKKGRMITHTILGDWPMPMPQKRFKPKQIHTSAWYPQSYRANCRASSIQDGYIPSNAADDNCRTMWSAQSGNSGEWFIMDFEKPVNINAIQINFADHQFDSKSDSKTDYHAYKLYYSEDGQTWKVLADKSNNRTAVPHEYLELDKPLKVSHLKVENVHTPRNGKFALLDLRVFGRSDTAPAPAPSNAKAERLSQDARCATVEWSKVDSADGYFVHFGHTPEFLNQSIQVRADLPCSLTLHTLIADENYYYRIDSYNAGGISEGKIFKETKK